MSDIGTGPRRHQAGYAIATVSIIGMIAMAGAASMFATGPVSEAREIEQSLFEVRGHWASMGMLVYALSRGRQDGACPGVCSQGDQTRAFTYEEYSSEIYNAKVNQLTLNRPFERRVVYTEIDDEYFVTAFVITGQVDNTSDNGKIFIEYIPDIIGLFNKDLKQKVNNLKIIAVLCLGLSNPSESCQENTLNNNNSGIARIADFRISRQ